MATKKEIIFLARQQRFDITVKGLLPKTYHYFYREKQQMAANTCKPEGGKLGDPLITDDNGNIVFQYYFDSMIETDQAMDLAAAQEKAATVANFRDVQLTNINLPTLPDDAANTALSYWTSHLIISVKFPADNEYEDKTKQTSQNVDTGPGPETTGWDPGPPGPF